MNVEEDEAGRLAAFRSKYGRSWDAKNTVSTDDLHALEAEKGKEGADAAAAAANAAAEAEMQQEEDNLLDLISSFGQEEADLPAPKQGGKKK